MTGFGGGGNYFYIGLTSITFYECFEALIEDLFGLIRVANFLKSILPALYY